MKIALVRPNYKSHLITPPLGLGYLSSYLKSRGHQAAVIDGLNLNLTNDEVVKHCEEADLVGVNILSAYFLEAKDLVNKLKAIGKKVVIGGPHPSALPKESLRETRADFAIVGEGEETLTELAEALENQRPVENILGFVSSKTGEIKRRPFIQDLNKLPFPDWNLIDPRRYKKAPHGGLIKNFPVAPVISSRGCPYECKFCASPFIWQQVIRFRSPENVVDEIEYLVKDFDVKEIHFEDDNLTLRREHIEKICNLILDRQLKISWATPNGIRADKIDLELLKLMKKSGCYYVVFGVESGNQEILDNIKKHEILAEIREAIRLAKRVGLLTQGFFILGLPGETEETIKRSINFAKESGLDRAQFLLLDLLPGSELYREHKDETKIDYSKKSYQDTTWVPGTITEECLKSWQPKAFWSFFLRPKQIFSLIRYFKPSQVRFIWQRLKDFRIFV